jgi:UDP-3-O-[3-hydroxymyristoyl] N-acetylglucosamine deacetylase
MVRLQRTLKNRIKCAGVALHSGARVGVTMLPAPPDTGIVFRRVDLPGRPEVAARHDRVADLTLCTSIGDGAGATIGTVEHLMAALCGLGVDNVVVELDGPEVPVMDGSAAPFVFLIECADLIEQAAPRRFVEVLKPVEVEDGGRSVALYPAADFAVSVTINFDSPVIGEQTCSFRVSPDSFKREIARARTFGFAHEVDELRARGLARGGSLENAVVVSGERVLNEDGLRFADEFVRHKALDAIGDLYLAGAPLLGHYRSDRAGHALNNRLLRQLFADETAWRVVTEKLPAAVATGVARRAPRLAAAAAGS